MISIEAWNQGMQDPVFRERVSKFVIGSLAHTLWLSFSDVIAAQQEMWAAGDHKGVENINKLYGTLVGQWTRLPRKYKKRLKAGKIRNCTWEDAQALLKACRMWSFAVEG